MTTHTIIALKNHPRADDFYKNCYCYDDEYVTAEPLVHQTTEVIDRLFTLQGKEPPNTVGIDFCLDARRAGWDYSNEMEKDSVVVYLTAGELDEDGSTYIVNPFYPEHVERTWAESSFLGEPVLEAWLCQHLCDYFSEPPQGFFAKITPIY